MGFFNRNIRQQPTVCVRSLQASLYRDFCECINSSGKEFNISKISKKTGMSENYLRDIATSYSSPTLNEMAQIMHALGIEVKIIVVPPGTTPHHK